MTFDFWQTLVEDSPDNLARQRARRIEAIAQSVRRAGHGLDLAQAEAVYEHSERVLHERFWSRDRDPLIADQVRLVLDLARPGLGARLDGSMLEEAIRGYIDPVLHFPPALHPGAAEAVTELAARGIALGIVSNTGRTPGIILRQVLDRYGLLRHFSVVSYSDEVGYRKPDAEIFRRTLAGLGAEARHAAHVGDNPDADVTGAQGAGMRGVHLAAGGRPAAAHADLVVADLGHLVERLLG
ncbi:MAG TPA: HAD family hydrolase [Candidatus Bathyarchaeia archaeon]|nr:HAD family hydrolase [Candidatus Bathyarchaeia archaeon]